MTSRSTDDLDRFDGLERALHWLTAALFGVLMLTAIPLYFGSASSIIGRRYLLAQVHTWCGVALPVPLGLSLVGPWGRGLRADVRRISRWTDDEVRWIRSLGRDTFTKLGKFNPGQKLNAIFVVGSIVVMLGTGAILRWFSPFPVSWRTGATFVHDVLATAIFLVVAGHIGFALTHRDALRSMFTGRISRRWARRHAPLWLAEMEGGSLEAAPASAPTRQMPRGSRAASQSRRATAQRKA